MRLSISRDYFDKSPTPHRLFLCTPSGKIIGELPAARVSLNAKWNSYSELSFEVARTHTDMLTGEANVHPLYDKVESPRQVYVENMGFFVLQDIDDTSSDNDVKSVTCFSAEYAVANKYLTSFYINTGEIGSREVTYNENMYGLDYSTDRDSFYQLASGAFNAYRSYYTKEYVDNDNYTYQQVQIADETAYLAYLEKNKDSLAQPWEQLYVKKFANVQFYDPTNTGLSLLHMIFEVIPDWKIGHVDASLWKKERSFSQDRVSAYDFLMNDVASTFGCVFEWDTINKTLNAYEEAEDGVEEDNTIQTRWATDVFISKDNLASEIKVSYSSDSIKTKLVVTGGEDLNISEVNLDRNEIMNLSFYHNLEWMEQDLFDAYNRYLDALKEAETGLDRHGLPSRIFPMSHSDAIKKWVASNNKHNDIMNAIPAENDSVLVGDEFKKLYCMYTPINTAFIKENVIVGNDIETLYSDTACTIEINKSSLSNGKAFIVQGHEYAYTSTSNNFKYLSNVTDTTALQALVSKLNLYHVDEDINGSKMDNILLRLKNAKSDTAIIRIYDPKRKVNDNYHEGTAYYKKKVSASGISTYEKLRIRNATEFANEDKNSLYTNSYTIQCVVTRAESGIEDAPSYWSMSSENLPTGATPKSFNEWIRGNLTASEMGLAENGETYTVSSIGTMGAYLVLAENEFTTAHNELISSNTQPTGAIEDGTMWLDTGSNPNKLYQYLNQEWVEVDSSKSMVVENTLVPSKDYLRRYGVNLLKEKHAVYTKIFQTQTEAMFSQEGYQCTASDEAPKGIIAEGTRWLDTNSTPTKLYRYTDKKWVEIDTAKDVEDGQNYTRYIENYRKLQAVQEVLAEKEHEANYCLIGHKVEDRSIDISKYTMSDDGFLRYGGRLLEEDMYRAAEAHFATITAATGVRYTITRVDVDQNLPMFTFMTSYDPIVYSANTKEYNDHTQYYAKVADFAYSPVSIDSKAEFDAYDGTLYIISSGHLYSVYLQGTTPYVSYADSRGVCQMIRDYIRNKTELSNFFNEDQWLRLSPFIREDEFSDSNFLLTGYESEEERVSISKELMAAATKELNTLCQPSLEFSMTMANILALPEFEPLIDQFQLGNFIRVQIRDGYVKRARLLEVNLDFDDLSNFSCTFGNLVTTKSEIDKHAELLAQAVTAGKQVAAAAGTWQKAAEATITMEEEIANGLQNSAIQVGKASGQSLIWNDQGILGRKLVDGTIDQYEPEQFKLVNNMLVMTQDNWQTSTAVFGKFEHAGETRWGVISQALVGGYIEGAEIVGGKLSIGGEKGQFVVNEDGSVEILGPQGNAKYADKSIEDAYRFSVKLEYSDSTVFDDLYDSCLVTCRVYRYNEDITNAVISNGGTFNWTRISSDSSSGWTPNYPDKTKPNEILITHTDVNRNIQLSCSVDFEETLFDT